MTLRDAIIEFAKREIFTKSNPPGKVKYNDWYYPSGHDYFRDPTPWQWCGTFCSYIYNYAAVHLGVPNPLADLPNIKPGMTNLGVHYIPTLYNYANKHKLLTARPKHGDLVIFDWNGDRMADHIGIFVSESGHYIDTIEGNTSDGSRGAGQQVLARQRAKMLVQGYVNLIGD